MNQQSMVSGHATAPLAEAARLMTVCNSCRYCEGLCAVFPAMEQRRAFPDGDLNYLANLCHSCGACYVDCQFAPPHEFDVNVPQTLATVRNDSYAHYAWPGALAPLFKKNGLAVALIAAASVALFLIGFIAASEPEVLWSAQIGPGAFYAVMPHNAMVLVFGTVFVYAIFAAVMSLRRFWRDISAPAPSTRNILEAIHDAMTLRYLDGGGVGCYGPDDKPTDGRRPYHHMTFYGFLLCFAATSVATIYHYVFGWQAPYGWFSLPVILGTLGGIGLIIGPAGLLKEKWARDPVLSDDSRRGMDVAFLVMLFLTSLTGLALLGLRETAAMGILLAIHLGVVFALFLTMPYGKFMHGLYRFLALVRYSMERPR